MSCPPRDREAAAPPASSAVVFSKTQDSKSTKAEPVTHAAPPMSALASAKRQSLSSTMESCASNAPPLPPGDSHPTKSQDSK